MIIMMPVDHLSGCQWPGASDQLRATDNNLDLDCCLQVVSHLLVVHSTVLGLRRRRYYILHMYILVTVSGHCLLELDELSRGLPKISSSGSSMYVVAAPPSLSRQPEASG